MATLFVTLDAHFSHIGHDRGFESSHNSIEDAKEAAFSEFNINIDDWVNTEDGVSFESQDGTITAHIDVE